MWHSNYIEIEWNIKWFYRAHSQKSGFWRDVKNRRKFLDELEKKLAINNPKNWGQIKTETILENGGSSLLRYYGGSMFKALSGIRSGK